MKNLTSSKKLNITNIATLFFFLLFSTSAFAEKPLDQLNRIFSTEEKPLDNLNAKELFNLSLKFADCEGWHKSSAEYWDKQGSPHFAKSDRNSMRYFHDAGVYALSKYEVKSFNKETIDEYNNSLISAYITAIANETYEREMMAIEAENSAARTKSAKKCLAILPAQHKIKIFLKKQKFNLP